MEALKTRLYAATENIGTEARLAEYAPLVRRLAHHMVARLPHSVEVDDLIQAGMMGLLDALGRYTEGRGAQFETYATQRIRGAMLDELREADWAPRGVRQAMRRIETAMRALEQRLGRAPGESEVAAELGLTLEEYRAALHEARGHQLVYYEDFADAGDEQHFLDRHSAPDEAADPLASLLDADRRRRLIAAIDELPEREKLVMSLYYDQELNLREIGKVLGVTESRVCQLHTQAVARLRSRLA